MKRLENLALGLLGMIMLLFAFKRVDVFMANGFGVFLIKVWIPVSILIAVCFVGKAFGLRYYWSVLLLVMVETMFAGLFLMAANRVVLPDSVLSLLRTMYMDKCRDIIQFNSNCGNYDHRLFYILKEGQFKFSNIEFNTTYHVNSSGFRDDERSLQNPDIILIGDSFTMGWGVEQNETFSQLVEKRMGKIALNLGVSSYGTAREVIAASKFELDSVGLVILQYGVDDESENQNFVANNFKLPISSFEELERHQSWNSIWNSWFPFKYCYVGFSNFASLCFESLKRRNKNFGGKITLSHQNLHDFFRIVLKFQETYSGEILLINFCQYGRSNIIPQQFKEWITTNKINHVKVLDLGDKLNSEDYFIIDDHLNAKGHLKVANILNDFILENKLLK